MTRCWSLLDNADPGTATTVKDTHGVVWERDGDIWWGHIGHTGEDGEPYKDFRRWHELLRRGPLVDVSKERTA